MIFALACAVGVDSFDTAPYFSRIGESPILDSRTFPNLRCTKTETAERSSVRAGSDTDERRRLGALRPRGRLRRQQAALRVHRRGALPGSKRYDVDLGSRSLQLPATSSPRRSLCRGDRHAGARPHEVVRTRFTRPVPESILPAQRQGVRGRRVGRPSRRNRGFRK